MHALLKKVASLFLCGSLVLGIASCNGEDTGPKTASGTPTGTTTGRYMEEQTSLNFSPITVGKGADGTYRGFGTIKETQEYCMGVSKDGGKTWTLEDSPWSKEIPQNSWPIASAFAPDGNLYLFLMDGSHVLPPAVGAEESEGSPQGSDSPAGTEQNSFSAVPGGDTPITLYRIGADQVLTKLDYQADLQALSMELTGLEALSDGDLLIATSSGIKQVDSTTGKEKFTYSADVDSCFAVKDGVLSVIYSGKITDYDTKTGKEISSITYPESVPAAKRDLLGYGLSSGQAMEVNNDGSAYLYLNRSGLYRIPKDGSAPEQILDGSMGSFSAPAQAISNIFWNADDSFLVTTGADMGEMNLYVYTFDPNAPSVPSKEIRVYSLTENYAIRQAVVDYQKANPDVKVNYTVGISDEKGGKSASDAIKELSMEIQAGKGPDVLVLDGLPIDTYRKNNLLYDLSDFSKSELSSLNLLPNATKAFTDEKGLWAIPARFSIPMFAGKGAENVNSLKEFSDWLSKEDKHQITMNAQMVPAQFYDSLYSGWFDENGGLQEEKIKEDIAALKTIAGLQRDKLKEMGAPEDALTEEYQTGMVESTMLAATKDSNGAAGTLKGLYDFTMTHSVLNALGLQMQPFPGKNAVFLPRTILGINAGSKEIETCKQFVKTTVSTGGAGYTDDFPVSLAKAQDAVKNTMEEGGMIAMSIGGGTDAAENFSVELKNPSEEELNQFYSMAGGLPVAKTENAVVKKVMLDEIRAYIAGTQDEATTLQNIKSKVGLYLSE